MMIVVINLGLLEDLLTQIKQILPLVFGGALFFVLGWIILKIIRFAVKSLLKITRLDKLNEKINENYFIQKTKIEINLSKIILGFVKWVTLLILVIIGSEILGLEIISNEIAKLIAYIPRFISVLAILVGGIYLATLLKKLVYTTLKSIDLNGSNLISNMLFYFLVIMFVITALNQAGIDTSIVTVNITIILGAFLLAFAVAFGLGSREIVYRLMLGFYTKKNIQLGSRIKVDDKEGVVESINNICLVLKTPTEKIIYPIKGINDKQVEILN